jgi:hypothetical protein
VVVLQIANHYSVLSNRRIEVMGALAFRLAYTPRRVDGLMIHVLQLRATVVSSFLVIKLDVWVPQEMQAVHANKVYYSPKTLVLICLFYCFLSFRKYDCPVVAVSRE